MTLSRNSDISVHHKIQLYRINTRNALFIGTIELITYILVGNLEALVKVNVRASTPIREPHGCSGNALAMKKSPWSAYITVITVSPTAHSSSSPQPWEFRRLIGEGGNYGNGIRKCAGARSVADEERMQMSNKPSVMPIKSDLSLLVELNISLWRIMLICFYLTALIRTTRYFIRHIFVIYMQMTTMCTVLNVIVILIYKNLMYLIIYLTHMNFLFNSLYYYLDLSIRLSSRLELKTKILLKNS